MTWEIGLVLGVLGVTVFLFVIDWLRVDVVAILVMVSLAWLGLVEPKESSPSSCPMSQPPSCSHLS